MPTTISTSSTGRRRGLWVNLLLLLAAVALFAIPLGLRLNASDAPEGEAYAGSDGQAENVIAEVDPGYEPWFSPLFEASSGEVESGLFAVQAALGAGGFGFFLGRMSGRRAARG